MCNCQLGGEEAVANCYSDLTKTPKTGIAYQEHTGLSCGNSRIWTDREIRHQR